MKLFGWNVVGGTNQRYVECPICGTADYRYAGAVPGPDPEDGSPENCRACGAHLLGDRSKDLSRALYAATVVSFYGMNALVWTMIWFLVLVAPICLAWQLPERVYPLMASVFGGAAWGLYRSRKAHLRGEMFVKRRTSIGVGAG